MRRDVRGLTIIELLITLAILLLVLAVFYSFYFYSIKSIDKANNQREVQQNVLLAKEDLERKIRFADCLIILKENPDVPGEEGCEGFTSSQELYATGTGVLMHTMQDETPKELLGAVARDTKFNLEFKKNSSRILSFTIKGDYKGEKFELSSDIALLNISDIQEEETGAKGAAIRYAFKD
ncbi:prepilin-type N-terminal cleavage/methylation domain-containing protein [Desulforamulus aquiferis]|uniref:Prepilin-type N-terminal cleavage/methylation domain-containing protein n=1 Tax=Desulforamulus aquiferis TaxID=1397668 RepID=A0AAW7ZHI0_9FIRM|nr:prepilin-type N-terminal cleavage/methylation domain-containing protein [Desulforamulus aquiferis]MDO7788639.1 prepilin-type N-terminal cleavage/methylation domain-containing protein [Desulforamulus aquiferis]RYD04363.1 hypothetical protein N752_13395 [Desulforamulus aquiferis]